MKGISGFETYYQAEFKDRWPLLKAALLEEKSYALVLNPFAEKAELPGVKCNWFPSSSVVDNRVEIPTAPNGLKSFYPLDAASLFPVMALDLKSGENVLDLCAAPGGKSLVMFMSSNGQITLTSNDRSSDRLERIKRIKMDYIPQPFHEKWRVTKHDASMWGLHEQNLYDKILVDVPCSSERHVLMDKKELEKWSIKRTKGLAIEQFSILCSALEAVKPNGRIVYSTCALSKLENDGVIEKLFKKREGRFRLIEQNFPFGQKTQYGWEIQPDLHQYGPFYLSIIEKIN